jgi:hypothetical protein
VTHGAPAVLPLTPDQLGSSGIERDHAGRAEVARIEAAEARAWADLYDAAPADWAAGAGVGTRMVDGTLVLHWAATQRRYFSRAIGLGVARPATRDALDAVFEVWEELGIGMCLVQSMPACEPVGYTEWLQQRGLEPFDAQDRIVRGGEPVDDPPAPPDGRNLLVEKVDGETAAEWSDFLQRVYHLDGGPWLTELVGRSGWHQYIAREDGEVVAARGMYIGSHGLTWLGMDGPVPGLQTTDFEPDAALCAAMVTAGLALGATGFLSDIEARSEEMDTPSYGYFGRLGFRRPYVRTHWAVV